MLPRGAGQQERRVSALENVRGIGPVENDKRRVVSEEREREGRIIDELRSIIEDALDNAVQLLRVSQRALDHLAWRGEGWEVRGSGML